MIDEEFLKILACPACATRPPVRLDQARAKLVCTVCGRRYALRDGIPNMLIEESEPPEPK